MGTLQNADVAPDAGEAASVWIGQTMRLVAGGSSVERDVAGVESGLRAHFGKRPNAGKCVEFIAQSWTHVKKQNELIRSLKRNLALMSETAVNAQKEVMTLQNNVIEVQEQNTERTETLVGDQVRDTLKTEIQSYSDVLANKAAEAALKQVPCQEAAAPTFEIMKRVVKSAAEEEERAKRLVFFGLEEGDKEGDEVDPNDAVEALGLEAYFDSFKILGVRKQGYNRPVLVTLRSIRHADEVLGKSHLLRHTEKFKSVFVSPDRTVEQRKRHRELVGQLAERRAEKRPGDERLRIVIRDGSVVSLPKVGLKAPAD